MSYLRPLREPPPDDELLPDERTEPLLDVRMGVLPVERTVLPLLAGREGPVPVERVPPLLSDELELLTVDWRTALLPVEEAGVRVVLDVVAAADVREVRVPLFSSAVRVPPVPDWRTALLPAAVEAEVRVVPAATAEPDLEVRAAAAVAEARVFVLPNVRAAADSRASHAERDARVPSVAGTADPRVVREEAFDAEAALVRAVTPRVSRCSWRALAALLPRREARAVKVCSG